MPSIHPALEWALGMDRAHPAVLPLMARYGGPTGLKAARRRHIHNVLAKKEPRIHAAQVERVVEVEDVRSFPTTGHLAAYAGRRSPADPAPRL